MNLKVRKKSTIVGGLLLLFIIIGVLTWHYWPYTEYEGIKMRPSWDIADNITNAPDVQIFAKAIYGAEYDTFLHGDGPFTVFVPTDKAYDNLPMATKAYMARDGNEGEARQVLLYHVVKGKYLSKDLKQGMKLKTIQGEELTFTKENDSWVINGYAYILLPNIVTKNGVIHLTTNYLLPPSVIEQ